VTPTDRLRRIGLWGALSAVTLLLCAATLAAGLYVGERILVWRHGRPSNESLGIMTIRYHTLYPYTGFQAEANARHQGPMPFENQDFYTQFDVRTGDHGFFVDFDLEAPPAKSPEEFRVILIGGSSAQGWGGSTNAKMLYRVLERQLNHVLAKKTGLSYRVVNLAMAGAVTYQNFVALNLWGHRLRPDAIISYSGGNDLFVPQQEGSDAFLGFTQLSAMVSPVPYEEQPAVFQWIDQHLPALGLHTGLKSLVGWITGSGVSRDRKIYLARKRYRHQRNVEGKDPIFEVALPAYIHALQSIKRDFGGIRMMVLFQPIDWRGAYPFAEQEYGTFSAEARAALRQYRNDAWVFHDLHQHWNDHGLFRQAKLAMGLHLPDHLQEYVANFIVEQTPEWFWRRRE
jgi:hypothetical protein